MSRFNYEMTPEKIERYICEGRGKGEGKDYKPWLTVFDVPSRGLVTRSLGVKTDRLHHTLSEQETNVLSILEICPVVLDIREQFPLFPQKETLLIAELSGIIHPKDPKTQTPIIMTTDFFITVERDGKKTEIARTVKSESDLGNKRTIEKLEIERIYWMSRGVDWGIITDKSIPLALAKNCGHFRDYYTKESLQICDEDFNDITELLSKKDIVKNNPLRIVARDCDRQLGLPIGTSLKATYHLISTRNWLANLFVPFNPGNILSFESSDSMRSVFGF